MSHDDWRNFDENPLPPLLQSALHTFMRQGYHGATTRNLAAEAGISVPGLYHHYPSKQAILVAITSASMHDLMRRSLAALDEAGSDPIAQFELHMECMVLFHAYFKDLAFLAASEIRSIEGEHRDTYLASRDAQEQLLRDIVQRGSDEGVFSVPDVKGAARALATVCTGVSQWFDSGGSRSAEDIASEYIELGRRVVGLPRAA